MEIQKVPLFTKTKMCRRTLRLVLKRLRIFAPPPSCAQSECGRCRKTPSFPETTTKKTRVGLARATSGGSPRPSVSTSARMIWDWPPSRGRRGWAQSLSHCHTVTVTLHCHTVTVTVKLSHATGHRPRAGGGEPSLRPSRFGQELVMSFWQTKNVFYYKYIIQ